MNMKPIHMHMQSKKDPRKLDFWSIVLPIAFDIVCGLLLIFFGDKALRITTYVLSGLMIILAVWLTLCYLRSTPLEKITHSYLACGLALAFSGTILAFNPDYLREFLPFVWGLALLFGAFLKFQYAFDEKAVKIEKWWILLIMAAFSLVIGILCLVNPDFLGDKREMFIGIILVVEAVLDIVVYLMLSKALNKLYPDPLPEEESAPAESVPAPEGVPAAPVESVPAPEGVPAAPAESVSAPEAVPAAPAVEQPQEKPEA